MIACPRLPLTHILSATVELKFRLVTISKFRGDEQSNKQTNKQASKQTNKQTNNIPFQTPHPLQVSRSF